MKVELLYFGGCPSYEALLPRVQDLVAGRAELQARAVESLEQAEAERFLGSPTVRVNGEDVDPGAANRRDYGMKCRLYRTASGQSHIPPDEWIERALERAS